MCVKYLYIAVKYFDICNTGMCNITTAGIDDARREGFPRRNKYYKTRELHSRNYNAKILLRNAE